MAKKRKSFFTHRFQVYGLLLLGGLILEIGVLFINWKEKTLLSRSLIVIGAITVLFCLYYIFTPQFEKL